MSHFKRTNSVASQSSNCGLDGGSPYEPEFSAVLTSPMPKESCQNRLTATRAVSGWSGLTSHFARAKREGWEVIGMEAPGALDLDQETELIMIIERELGRESLP